MICYQCVGCKAIYKVNPKQCEGCQTKTFAKEEALNLEDIVQIIHQFSWREIGNYDNNPHEEGIPYWDLFAYVESFAGEITYIMFDKALRKGESKKLFWKTERIIWED